MVGTGLFARGFGVALGVILFAVPAGPQTKVERALGDLIRTTEDRMDARIGVHVHQAGSDWAWEHRGGERFLMASVFKSVLCGAVLAAADRGALDLDEPLEIRPGEIHSHAPVTRPRAGQTMTVSDLCLATLDQSDNGAANLLIDRLGGPGAVTSFLRAIGDDTTRLDRKEPDVNIFAPGDPRDTTTPSAIAATWQNLLLGDALSADSRGRLTRWMSLGGVTQALIRPHVPAGWAVADKSGGGRGYTRNIVAMLSPGPEEHYLVAIFLSDTPADWEARNAAVSDVAGAVVALIRERRQ